ncbi:MAG: S41 family peptidase [Candidatus Pacebacteria bacterium]|nr:S41 family peptidase [Candidatus Paceibacterota bacterium]
MKNFFSRLSLITVSVILIGASFGLGFFLGGQQAHFKATNVINQETGKPSAVDFSPFWKAWNILENKFVSVSTSTDNAVSNEDKVWGAIEGLAASYGDPYTVFFPPVEAEIFESDISGNFQGVGMEIGIRDGILTVISPLKGTPAFRAGLLAQDKILAIDEESTANLGIEKAVQKIRGLEGTTVVLTIYREGVEEPFDVSITRAVIDIPTIETELRSDGIFVIRLFSFSATSPNLFRNALREFILTGSNKLILDLRNNPGGYLEAAVDIASWFLPAGKIIAVEDFGGEENSREHRSKGYDIFNDTLKFVILVNRGSASASEILAGALSELGAATVVGQQTFGKGSVQELVDITDKTSLKITIAKWLTPNGNSISVNGLTPDVVIEMTLDDLEKDRDPQLQKAVEILLNK